MTARSSRGVSLTEVMVATAIITIGVLAFTGAFKYIAKGLSVSRARILAANLAQEKIETLKDIPYYGLLVTTNTFYDNSTGNPIAYDPGNYYEATITIGGINFTRYTEVDYVYMNNSNNLAWSSPFGADTALKRINVNVLWVEDGATKVWSLTNLLENPNVNPLDSTIYGQVTIAPNPPVTSFQGAIVKVMENPDWSALTDSGGNYSFRVHHGSYTVNFSSYGYYGVTSYYVNATAGGNTLLNNTLTRVSTGNIAGNVWINPGLVISQVVASTSTAPTNPNVLDMEYVTLFNPTTYQINIINAADCMAAPPNCKSISNNPLIHLNLDSAYSPGSKCINVHLIYISTYVPSGYYYTISNSTDSTPMLIGGQQIIPDAIYDRTLANPCSVGGPPPSGAVSCVGSVNGWQPTGVPPPLSTHIMVPCHSESVLISDNNNNMIDAVGWKNQAAYPNNFNAYNPAWQDCLPTTSGGNNCLPFNLAGSHDGLQPGLQIVRVSTPMANTNVGFDLENYGQAYNSGYNQYDFMYAGLGSVNNLNGIYLAHLPQSTSSSMLINRSSWTVISGVPAIGAFVAVSSDPFSSVAVATQNYVSSGTLSLPIAPFLLPGVATGTWSVAISSSIVYSGNQENFYQLVNNVVVATAPVQYIANAVTAPRMPSASTGTVILSSSVFGGFVTGQVLDVSGNPISGIHMTASGMNKTTNNNGIFFGVIPSTGPVIITANSYSNPGYNPFYTALETPATVTQGGLTNLGIISLPQSGTITGFATSGTTPLPNIVIIAVTQGGGSQAAQTASGFDGSFTMHVTTGIYTVEPVIDTGQSSSPPSYANISVTTNGTVIVGTFTITGAYGNITGPITAVTAGVSPNPPVTTGALILASTGTIPTSIAASSSAALGAVLYAVSSKADGTYTLPVRGGYTYTMKVYLPVISGNTVVLRTVTYPSISVIAGQNVTQAVNVP